MIQFNKCQLKTEDSILNNEFEAYRKRTMFT